MTVRTKLSNAFYSISAWVYTWGEMIDDRADEDHFGIDEIYTWFDEGPGITDEQWEKAAQYAAEGRRPADYDWSDRPSPEEALHYGPGVVYTANKGWVEFSTVNDPTTFVPNHELGRLEDDGGPARPADARP